MAKDGIGTSWHPGDGAPASDPSELAGDVVAQARVEGSHSSQVSTILAISGTSMHTSTLF